jgi:hypothetical protein
MALCWAAFSVFKSYTQHIDSIGGGSARRKATTCTQGTQTQYIYTHTHTDIHILSGIQTHDPSVAEGLRQLGY